MNAKILIVDDSALARRMVRQFLEELGHTVDEATDGTVALQQYESNRHDVVILDLVMHGMNGLETLAKFRQLNAEAAVIVATADIQKSTREQARAAGAAALINKPLQKSELAEILDTVLAGGTQWT
jgi:two-component system, chemotaxis family, chemotaxis protein CheY